MTVLTVFISACGGGGEEGNHEAPAADTLAVKDSTGVLHYPEEGHLKNVKQLTFGGDNAEAYWSFDNKNLVLQITNPN